jgi:hypothetical protein
MRTGRKKTIEISFDYDFVLMGIVSSQKSHRLCWEINRKLNIALQRLDDLELNLPGRKTVLHFPLYEFEDEESCRQYYMIGNRDGNSRLVPENKEIDYFLMCKGLFEDNTINFVLSDIKASDLIQAALVIDHQQLKSKQNLIF